MRFRKRHSIVRNKVTKQVGRVILKDKDNVYVLWNDQCPQETVEGPAIFARPYSQKFLERI